MLKGFKEFMLRGNIIDLAIAVVIGVAFTDLVKVFTASFIDPIIRVAMGGGFTGGSVELDDQNRLEFGIFLNGLVTFAVTAAIVYFAFVVPMKNMIERRKRGEEPAPAVVAEDVRLLGEIRDLLADRGTSRTP